MFRHEKWHGYIASPVFLRTSTKAHYQFLLQNLESTGGLGFDLPNVSSGKVIQTRLVH
jgi:hypothetical protein